MMRSVTVLSLVKRENLDIRHYDGLVLDAQGAGSCWCPRRDAVAEVLLYHQRKRRF